MTRQDIDIQSYKVKLEEELALLESELEKVGRKNPSINNDITDWEARPADFDTDTADDTEEGDRIEEYEENTAVVKNLEIRYNNIKRALRRIAEDTYGICKDCNKEISKERLEANPAADTCKEHMGS